MDATIENLEGIYVPRAYGYPHSCPVCQTTFYGRKNQVFCSVEHKIKANNNKAAIRKVRVGGQSLILERNVQIIFELTQEKNTPFTIEKEKLLEAGFMSDGPSIQIRAADNSTWSQIGYFFIRTDKNSNIITIMNLENFKKL